MLGTVLLIGSDVPTKSKNAKTRDRNRVLGVVTPNYRARFL